MPGHIYISFMAKFRELSLPEGRRLGGKRSAKHRFSAEPGGLIRGLDGPLFRSQVKTVLFSTGLKVNEPMPQKCFSANSSS